jgi:hypothetical protein
MIAPKAHGGSRVGLGVPCRSGLDFKNYVKDFKIRELFGKLHVLILLQTRRDIPMKYGLLWLLGVPIPLLIIGFLIFH